MNAVQQTKFGIGNGNCLLACVASVLNRDLESIPDFAMSGIGWFDELYEWCLNEQIGVVYFRGDVLPPCLLLNCEPILIFEVIGSSEHHAVVGKTVLDESTRNLDGEEWKWTSEIAHDPNPNYKELGKLTAIVLLIPSAGVK